MRISDWSSDVCSSDLAPAHEADTNTTPTPAPQRAGQPVDPIKTAGHIAAARVAAITGNQEGVHRNMEAMTEDLRRAMKLPDAGPAPSFAATGSSNRSASHSNPSATPSPSSCTCATQTPRTRDEADSLGRNCQLAPGDVALLQRERQIDPLTPLCTPASARTPNAVGHKACAPKWRGIGRPWMRYLGDADADGIFGIINEINRRAAA